jgi:hypothetical protein
MSLLQARESKILILLVEDKLGQVTASGRPVATIFAADLLRFCDMNIIVPASDHINIESKWHKKITMPIRKCILCPITHGNYWYFFNGNYA